MAQVARIIFLLAERKVYHVLLEDLYPDFICSHNQIYTIESRSYSVSSEQSREIAQLNSETEIPLLLSASNTFQL